MKKRKRILEIICLTAGLLCFTAGFVYEKKAGDFSHSVVIRSTDGMFAPDILERLSSETDAEYTFSVWGERKDQQITASESKRACRGDAITIYGPTRCVLPYGQGLQTEETDSCIISEDLAEELFGSHRAKGQQILYMGQTLTVQSVVAAPKGLLIREAGTEDLDADRISILLPEGKDGNLVCREFISRYGLAARALRFDFSSDLSWLIEAIPGKWSDFDGWKENLKAKKREMQFVSSAERSNLEAYYLSCLRKRNVCMAAGIIFFMAGFCMPWAGNAKF